MATVDDIASKLRADPLYVHPEAMPEFTAEGYQLNEDAARDRLKEFGEVYVAILPSNKEDPNLASDLGEQLVDGNPGPATVLALFGPASGSDDRPLSVASNRRFSPQELEKAAESALLEAGDDLDAGVSTFVDKVEAAVNGDSAGDSGNSGGGSGLLPLGILAAVGGGGFLLYRRNQRAKERAQLVEVRQALDEDITAYGEQLSALDLDVQSTSNVPEDARTEYGRALDLYETAKEAADRAERPTDLRRVTTALEEGRWLLKCVDARLKGDQVPERRLPCFFDPSHGPSVEDVQWAPMNGAPRSVPACAADASRIGHGEDPESRMVRTANGDRPYWDAGPAYAGWAGGYYGGFLPGILWGTMLGSAMSGPIYAGDGGGGGGDFDGGGGDFGGFDGGGGDFGGFGGGDFGGF